MTMTSPAPSVTGQRSGAALEVRGVSKRFGAFTAVEDVSFDIKAGEFLTMLGPSGSGKTTTLNMIAGFLTPDTGQILLDGRDITAVAPHKRNIGMVFQNYALFPHMSAVRNVAFPLEMRGMSRKEALKRAHAALEVVELDRYADRLPRQLSGGQQQRVALARAFVYEPDLLLMDEPLGALDKRLRETMQIEIMRICRNLGITVVYVTHDQQEALVMSDRIAIYRDGRIEQLGTAADLYERPVSVFVAEFIGESNILTGRVGADGAITGAGWVVPARGGHQPGAQVAVVIRPEAVTVAPETGSEVRPNSVVGRITECIYLGSEYRYLIETSAGTFKARHVRTGQSEVFRPGERVRASWRPDDCVILPNSPGARPAA